MKDKIKKIYEEIANKELNFWCMFTWFHTEWFEFLSHTIRGGKVLVTIDWDIYSLKWKKEDRFVVDKIKWHTVLIWDVLDWYREWAEQNINNSENYLPQITKIADNENKILTLWEYKRKPIECQPKECIDFVYNLTTENERI